MSGFSEKALEAGGRALEDHVIVFGCTCRWDEDGNPPPSCRCGERAAEDRRGYARLVAEAMSDPALGLDRSVRLGDVLDALERERDEQLHRNTDNANAMHYAMDVVEARFASPDGEEGR